MGELEGGRVMQLTPTSLPGSLPGLLVVLALLHHVLLVHDEQNVRQSDIGELQRWIDSPHMPPSPNQGPSS